MQKYLLRLFCGGYNTLQDSAISWLEPANTALYDVLDSFEDSGIEVSEKEFIEFFNAWIMNVCDSATALGHTISDEIRLDVRIKYERYGLEKDWKFSQTIRKLMGWKDDSPEMILWRRIISKNFLDVSNIGSDRYYIDLSRVRPRFDMEHKWYRCEKCSEITPYTLKSCCPSCGSKNMHIMNDEEMEFLDFWRKPI